MTKHGPFIMLPHGIFDGPGYRVLHPTDRDVLMLLLRKHNGRNNGAIPLGTRAAAKQCHRSQSTTCRALAKLQEVDFISATRKGHLVPEIGRPNVATLWRLNFLEDASATSALSRPREPPQMHHHRYSQLAPLVHDRSAMR